MNKKIKTSLYVKESVWREIKKAAIDTGQNIGEFITKIFNDWMWKRDNRKPVDTGSSAKNRPDRS